MKEIPHTIPQRHMGSGHIGSMMSPLTKTTAPHFLAPLNDSLTLGLGHNVLRVFSEILHKVSSYCKPQRVKKRYKFGTILPYQVHQHQFL